MRRKRLENNSIYWSPEDIWRITFSDMIMLLLTFFILIVAMGTLNDKVIKKATKTLRSIGIIEQEIQEKTILSKISVFSYQDKFIAEIMKAVSTLPENQDRNFIISENERGITITVPEDEIFEDSSFKIKSGYVNYLKIVAAALKNTSDFISIEGHAARTTNKVKDDSSSLAMASSLLDYFIYDAGMSPTRFSISGYGSAREILGKSKPGAIADNGRIEIVILKSNPYPVVLEKAAG